MNKYNIIISFNDSALNVVRQAEDFAQAVKLGWDLREELYNSMCGDYNCPHRKKILQGYRVAGFPEKECENRYREYIRDHTEMKIIPGEG